MKLQFLELPYNLVTENFEFGAEWQTTYIYRAVHDSENDTWLYSVFAIAELLFMHVLISYFWVYFPTTVHPGAYGKNQLF